MTLAAAFSFSCSQPTHTVCRVRVLQSDQWEINTCMHRPQTWVKPVTLALFEGWWALTKAVCYVVKWLNNTPLSIIFERGHNMFPGAEVPVSQRVVPGSVNPCSYSSLTGNHPLDCCRVNSLLMFCGCHHLKWAEWGRLDVPTTGWRCKPTFFSLEGRISRIYHTKGLLVF